MQAPFTLLRSDIPEAVALWQACGLTRPWNDPVADAERAIDGPASAILGLRDGDALIATAMTGYDGHRGWIYYLAVAEARRGQGLGRAMVQAAEAWLRAAGAPKVLLMVREGNAAAQGFYAALGYEVQPVVTLGRFLG